jgi:hypothetical protein
MRESHRAEHDHKGQYQADHIVAAGRHVHP